MNSDLIQHPCVICQKPSRSCGHTREDKHRYYDECRELRRKLKAQQEQPKKRKRHKIEGANVFQEREDDERPLVYFAVGGKILKGRFTTPVVVRDLTDDDYCGGPRRDPPRA